MGFERHCEDPNDSFSTDASFRALSNCVGKLCRFRLLFSIIQLHFSLKLETTMKNENWQDKSNTGNYFDFWIVGCGVIFIIFHLLTSLTVNVTRLRNGDSSRCFWPATATLRIRIRIRRGRKIITFDARWVTRSWSFIISFILNHVSQRMNVLRS